MTDADLVRKKLAFIETSIRELRSVADLSRLTTDIREQRFIEHTLQLAIQAALDIASHVVSDERLGEPATNTQLFDLLARAGIIDRDLSETLARMTGFRNILVHGYGDVDLRIVEDVVKNRLVDLEAFVAKIRSRLPGAVA